MPYCPVRYVPRRNNTRQPPLWLRVVAAALFAGIAATIAGGAPSPWSLREWRSDDGLPNNHVTGLAQTPDGYLWVATYSAPARFDGTSFEEFPPKNLGLGSNQKIAALAPAREGGLWLGLLHGGVLHLSAAGLRVFNQNMPYHPVQSMTETPDGTLWVTHQGGTVVRLQGNKATPFGPQSGLPAPETPNRYVCSFAVDIAGRLWFSKDGQVGVFRDDHFVTLVRLDPLNARIARASGGGVWIGSDGQLFRFAEGAALERLGRYAPSSAETTALMEDSQGAVWIGTGDAGLFHYANGHFQPVPTSDLRIEALLEDRKGLLWAGTSGGGLNQIRPRLVTLESDETGLPTGVIQSITQDASGTVWATTQSGLLVRRAVTEWQTISAGPKWPGGRAASLASDAEGGVWIGTRDRALHRWREGAFTSWRRADGLAGREIHALVAARNGDIWMGFSSPYTIQRLRAGRLTTFNMPENIRVIRAMAEDAAGDIWIGSSRGLLVRIHGDVVSDETGRTTGQPCPIRCLRATEDGALWIGYADDGIGRLKDGHFARVSSEAGLPENNISQLLPDRAGWLWFAGDHGIFKVRQNALEELALEHSGQPHFIHLGRSEGLFSAEANFGDTPGGLRTSDGRLWFPLRNALAIVDPRQAQEDKEPPPVLLRRVLADDRVVAAYAGTLPLQREVLDLGRGETRLRLPPDHLRLTFEFTALTFRAPENARFRYRLEGFDHDWIDARTQRTATYSRLPAGDYRFCVQACNSDGTWNETGAALALAVTPFAWQTWWFRLAALGVFTSSTAFVVRRISLRRTRDRLRRLEQQAAIQKERMRIARDLHDEFGTRLTELGLIAELDRHPVGGASDSDFIGHIRSLERDLDTIVWAVNPKNDTVDHLVSFIGRVNAEFLARSGVSCRLDLPDILPPRPVSPELRHNVFLVVREAVANVVKHASATCVTIAVALERDTLRVRIENDGRGFAVATAEAGERNGLKNMRGRLAEIHGTFSLKSHPETGTVIELTVPLAPEWDEVPAPPTVSS